MKKEKKTYKLSENYFEDFQDRLLTQIELETLLGTEIKSGFTVPEGYFEVLSQELLKIPSQKEIKPKVLPLNIKNWFWPGVSMAATVLILFTMYLGNTEKENTLEIEDIATYLEIESANLHTQDIAALLTDEEINVILQDDENHKEDDIINYLETYATPYDLYIE